MSAVSYSSSSIYLSWLDNSTNETGFKIERSANGGGWGVVSSTGPNARSLTNYGLSSSSTYAYRVYAYGAGGSSA